MSAEPLTRKEIRELRVVVPTGDRANDPPWPLIASLLATIDHFGRELDSLRADVAAHCRRHGVETVGELAGLVQVYREERDEAENLAEGIAT